MSYGGKSRRLRERMKLSLPLRVHYRESASRDWVEMTRLADVTPFGAGFVLTRPVEPGRLLHLTMAMPRQLRCYDYVEPQYQIWALVRHIKMLPPQKAEAKGAEGQTRFHVGTAFTGKHPPQTYWSDPATRYEVAQSAAEARLWELREKSGDEGHVPRERETRLQMAADVTVELLGESGEVVARETTVTENISRRGAAVFTTLKAERGTFARLTSAQTGLSLLAVVRGSRAGAGGIPRLHFEFLGQHWPLEGME